MHESVLLPGTLHGLEPVVALGPVALGSRPCSGVLLGAPGSASPGPSASFHKAFLMRGQVHSSMGSLESSRCGSSGGDRALGDGSRLPPPPLEMAYISDGCGGGGGGGGGAGNALEDFTPPDGVPAAAALLEVPRPSLLASMRGRKASGVGACPSVRASAEWSPKGPAGSGGGSGAGAGGGSGQGTPALLEAGGGAAIERIAVLGTYSSRSLRPRSIPNGGSVVGAGGSAGVSVAGAYPNSPLALRPAAAGRLSAAMGAGSSCPVAAAAAEDGPQPESDSDQSEAEPEQGQRQRLGQGLGQASRRGSLLGAAASGDGLGPMVPRRGSVLAWSVAGTGSGHLGSPSIPSPVSRPSPSSPGAFRRPEDIPAAPSPSSSRSLAAGSNTLSPTPGTPVAASSPRPPPTLQPTPSGRFSLGFSRRPEDLPAAPHPAHSRSLAPSAASTPGTPVSGISSPRPTLLAMQQSSCSSCSGCGGGGVGGGRRQTEESLPTAGSSLWSRASGGGGGGPPSPAVGTAPWAGAALSPQGSGGGAAAGAGDGDGVSRRESGGSVGLSRRLEDLPAAPSPRDARSLAAKPASSGGARGEGAPGASDGPMPPLPSVGSAPPRSTGLQELPQTLQSAVNGSRSGSVTGPPSPSGHLRRLASSLMGAIRPESAGRQRPSESGPPAAAPGSTSVSVSVSVRPSPPSPQLVSVRPAPPSPRPSTGTSAVAGSGGGGAGTIASASDSGHRSIGYSRRMQDLPAAPGPSNSRSLSIAPGSGGVAAACSVAARGVAAGSPASAPEGSTRRVGWRASVDGPGTPPSGGTHTPPGASSVGISRRPEEIPAAPSPGQARSLRAGSCASPALHQSFNARAPASTERWLTAQTADKAPGGGASGGGGGGGSGGEARVYAPVPPAGPAPSSQQQLQQQRSQLYGRGLSGARRVAEAEAEAEACAGGDVDVVEDLEAD